MSGTLLLRRSLQSSLNVSPSTPTRAPFTGMSALMSIFTVRCATYGPIVVVDAAAGEDHLRLVAELLRLRREVVRIDADAVAADEARA